jgi:hypothetical protein
MPRPIIASLDSATILSLFRFEAMARSGFQAAALLLTDFSYDPRIRAQMARRALLAENEPRPLDTEHFKRSHAGDSDADADVGDLHFFDGISGHFVGDYRVPDRKRMRD